MTPLATRLAPALLALTAVLTAGTGVAVAADLRADERSGRAEVAADREADRKRAADEAAAAARGAAEAAYLDRLRPLAESVFDHVQPLAEAEGQFDDDANGGFAAYVDLSRLPTTGEALAARHRDVLALTAPPSLRSAADELDGLLEQFELSARLYREIPFDGDDDDAFADAAVNAEGSLDRTITRWREALEELYGEDAPTVPYGAGSSRTPARRPLSQGSFVLAADRLCGKAEAADEGTEPPSDPAAFAALSRKQADLLRETVRGLVAVPGPGKDRARLDRDLLAPLRESGRAAVALDDLADGVEAGDPDAVTTATGRLEAASAAAARAADGYRAYGAVACADFFEA